jgi:hypothetical protein
MHIPFEAEVFNVTVSWHESRNGPADEEVTLAAIATQTAILYLVAFVGPRFADQRPGTVGAL